MKAPGVLRCPRWSGSEEEVAGDGRDRRRRGARDDGCGDRAGVPRGGPSRRRPSTSTTRRWSGGRGSRRGRARPARREGRAGRGGGRRGARALLGRRRPGAARGRGPRDRGDRRGARPQGGAVRGRSTRRCRPEAILATNTSALSVTAIAAASGRPERVVGLHFFNPAPLMPLVEVVRTSVVDEDAFAAALAFAQGLGKVAVPCPDTPGFLVNRLLIPLLNDAVRMLDETGAAPEDVDRALKAGAGWPMGPLALIDLIGIDVQVHAAEALWQAHREERMAAAGRASAHARGRAPRAARPAAASTTTASRPGRARSRPAHSRTFTAAEPACGTLLPIMGSCGASRPWCSSSWSSCWRCRSPRPRARAGPGPRRGQRRPRLHDQDRARSSSARSRAAASSRTGRGMPPRVVTCADARALRNCARRAARSAAATRTSGSCSRPRASSSSARNYRLFIDDATRAAGRHHRHRARSPCRARAS